MGWGAAGGGSGAGRGWGAAAGGGGRWPAAWPGRWRRSGPPLCVGLHRERGREIVRERELERERLERECVFGERERV